jgi:threonine dehydratase
MISFQQVKQAQQRIQPYINLTPIVESSRLNNWLGHRILFKAECLQKIGAFKARGGCNTVAKLVEENNIPNRIIANSSGNHAQAVAWAAALFNIPATIYMPAQVSTIKAQATKSYGAEIIFSETRAETDALIQKASEDPNNYWIPPYNHQDVIAGQGTAVLEALQQASKIAEVNAVFAPCGGGGLLSGSLLATRELAPDAKVIGVEPALGNDASRSIKAGSIQILAESPNTLADGARTLQVGELTFPFLQQLDEFYEVSEEKICYWSQWLSHLLKLHIEPTSAMCMDAVSRWLKTQNTPQTVIVVLSGGNIDQQMQNLLWAEDYLGDVPGS